MSEPKQVDAPPPAEERQDAMDARRPTVRVHTKSIEQVLLPIANQVGELMILDERARHEGKGIPDLTQAAESVGGAVQNLVQVGHRAMEQGDDLLKSRMPVACEQIQAAAKLFMDAALELKLDPLATASRGLLVQAARGLLDGTTSVLMTFDAYEVRKIVVLGESIIELLASAKAVNTVEELVVLVKTLSDHLIRFAQLVETRQRELINASVRSAILAANEALRKTSPLLVTSLRTYIGNKDNEQAKASRNYAVEEALGAVHAIIMGVSNTDVEESSAEPLGGSYTQSFDDAIAQLHESELPEGSTQQLVASIQTIVEQGEEVAASSTNPRRAETVKSAIGTLEKTTDAFKSAAPAERADLAASVRQHMQALDQVIRTAIAEQVAHAVMEQEGHRPSTDFIAAATDGTKPPQEQDRAVERFNEQTQHLLKAAGHMAHVSQDARRVDIVSTTGKQVQGYAKQLTTAAEVVRANPKDTNAQQHLALLKQTFEHRADILKTTVSSMVDAPRMVAVAGENTQTQLLQGASRAAQGDAHAVEEAVDGIDKQVRLLVDVASSEVENSEDPAFRDPIDQASQNLQQVHPRVTSDLRALAASPGDEKCRVAASSSTTDLKRNIRNLQLAVKGEPVPESEETMDEAGPDLAQTVSELQQEEVAREEAALYDEEENDAETTGAVGAPSTSSEEGKGDTAKATMPTTTTTTEKQQQPGGGEDAGSQGSSVPATPLETHSSVFAQKNPPTGPIAVAALSLKKETDRWSDRKNPIVTTAKGMAEQMASMANIASADEDKPRAQAPGAKGDMIGTAKGIAEQAKDIRQQAMDVAQNCSDKRLKEDLLYLCDRLPTISTQLKIIASVKAASSSQSNDADAMLIKNAQNLMDTVQRTVRACEAASLKLFTAAANTAVAAIKWRRKTHSSLRLPPKA